MRVVFMGTPEFAVPSLKALRDAGYGVVGVFTQPDRPVGRGHKLAACPAVQECIVKEKSQKICAVVYCAKEQQAEVKDFITECNRTLPLYKRIGAVEFTAEPLPRNALGKLLRK